MSHKKIKNRLSSRAARAFMGFSILVLIISCSPFKKKDSSQSITQQNPCLCNANDEIDHRLLGKWIFDSQSSHCFVDPPIASRGDLAENENNVIVFLDTGMVAYRTLSKSSEGSDFYGKGKWKVSNNKLFTCVVYERKSSVFPTDTITNGWSSFDYRIENDSVMQWKSDCFVYTYVKQKKM